MELDKYELIKDIGYPKKMTRYKFWMVFADGGHAPTKQHLSQAEAEAEAQRIARKNRRAAYVLEAVAGYEPQNPPVVRFATEKIFGGE